MAEDIGSLYVRLGLDISELETGFVAVSRTVNENVRRLNRESDLIRLRSEVEITGLDETADAARILQIRQNALNQQMAIQRDRVRILTAELQSLTLAHGSEAVATQRAAIRLERERLALAQLEQDLRNLGDTQEETNSRFGELAGLLPPIPTKLQAIGIAAGVVASGFGAAAAAVNELLEDFRELQTQSYELNLPVNETKKILRELKLAGGDIGDFEGYIRGITDAYVKGEYDDPEFIAIRRYGAEIVDATGKLKNFADISDEVFKAWEKAEAEGNGIEFLQLTGGESGVRDAIQLFKRLKEAREDAAKIYDANIDAGQLHDLDRAFARVEEQAKELKNAIGNIFVPAAQAAAEKLFNTLYDGTEWLVENKDAIQEWGFIAAEVFSTVADNVKKGYDAVGEFVEEAMKPKNTTGNEKVDKMMSGLDWRYGSAQTPYGVDKMAKGITESTESYGILNDVVERGKEKQKEYNAEIEKAADDLEGLNEKLEDADGNPLSQYGWQRVQQFRAELDELRAELDNWGNDYETALAQLELWRDQELTQKNYVSNEERLAVEELYSAKLEQIEQERADKIEEIRRGVDAEFQTALEQRLAKIEEEKQAWIEAGMEESEAAELAQKRIDKAMGDAAEKAQQYLKDATDIEYEMTHTAFEKQLRDIEQWEEAQRKKADTAEEVAAIIKNSAAKEAEAFEREVDRIKGKIQTLEDKIFEQEHSQYENDLRKLQQERLNYYEEGVYPSELIERYYNNAVNDLRKRASESRTSGGDYTNTPNGGMQRGGNGIMVIEGDQIIDGGLIRGQQQEISLMADENRIRAQVMQSMTAEQRARIEEIKARQESANAQRQLTQAVQQAASGFQIIEGDTLVTPSPQILQQSANDYQIIESDQVIAMPTAELQQFGNTIQQTRAELEQSNPFQSLTDTQALLMESTQGLTDAQKSLHTAMNDLPPEYFRNLADSAKSVSEMQFALTESTMKLIDAQDALKNVLLNLPTGQSSDRDVIDRSDRYLSLETSTREVEAAQDLLARTTREANAGLSQISDIPTQRRDTQRDSGWKLGFDYDTAKDIMLTGVGLAAASATTGIGIAVSPEILAGSVAAALGGGFIKGSYDATTATPQENLSTVNADLSALQTVLENIDTSVQGIRDDMKAYSSEKQPELQEIPMPEWLSQPLNALDTPLSNILQEVQNAKVENAEIEGSETYENVNLQELFGTLPNIEMGVQNILQEMQTQATHETTLSFETIVTPLEHIAGIGQDILSALSTLKDSMGRQQPPQITVSPSNSINLGGAYVFDNAMKTQLINDITSTIVDKITTAVQQATSSSYGYGV